MGKKQIIIGQYENEIYEGVTRFDNGRVTRGDYDELEHKHAFIESGYGQVPEGQRSNYREIHAENAKRSHEAAIKEASAFEPMRSSRSDLHGTPTPGYVAPHEKPINGYAALALVACLSVLLVKTITGG